MTKIVGVNTSLSPASSLSDRMSWGENALSAPLSSQRMVPIVNRDQVNPEILRAAEGMETMFLDYMMKVMRQTVPKNDMDLESPATEIYRSMMDAEYAEKAAHHGGIGLADQIIAYLSTQGYHLQEGHEAPKKEKP